MYLCSLFLSIIIYRCVPQTGSNLSWRPYLQLNGREKYCCKRKMHSAFKKDCQPTLRYGELGNAVTVVGFYYVRLRPMRTVRPMRSVQFEKRGGCVFRSNVPHGVPFSEKAHLRKVEHVRKMSGTPQPRRFFVPLCRHTLWTVECGMTLWRNVHLGCVQHIVGISH